MRSKKYCIFGSGKCEVSIFLREMIYAKILFTKHVSRNEQRNIFQKIIKTSHTVLPIIQYTSSSSLNLQVAAREKLNPSHLSLESARCVGKSP